MIPPSGPGTADETELNALATLEFTWAIGSSDVWSPAPSFVDDLQPSTTAELRARMSFAHDSGGANPIGVILQGAAGTGKTRLLGWIREQIQDRDGYFVFSSPIRSSGLWDQTVLAILDSLCRTGRFGHSQLQNMLDRLCGVVSGPDHLRAAVTGQQPLTGPDVELFARLLQARYPEVTTQQLSTLRALALLGSADFHNQETAWSYLTASAEIEPGAQRFWGLTHPQQAVADVVRDLFALVAIAGPCVLAIDHIDTVIASESITPHGPDVMTQQLIAEWLMTLREVTRRCLTVVACLPSSWQLVKQTAVGAALDRFTSLPTLGRIPGAAKGQELVRKTLGYQFAQIAFTPPYDTWPVRPEAFDDAHLYTPRQLMQRIDEHIRACLRAGTVEELGNLATDTAAAESRSSSIDAESINALDARFAQLKSDADIFSALDPEAENTVVPRLLNAGLKAWITEQTTGTAFKVDPHSASGALHARLRLTLDQQCEDEAHWSFRAISSTQAVSVLTRVRSAAVMAGLNPSTKNRKLILLRNTPWPETPKTTQTIAELVSSGARVLHLSSEDLRVLNALEALFTEQHPGFASWLRLRRPGHGTNILQVALADTAAS